MQTQYFDTVLFIYILLLSYSCKIVLTWNVKVTTNNCEIGECHAISFGSPRFEFDHRYRFDQGGETKSCIFCKPVFKVA